MNNDHVPPGRQPQQTVRVPTNALDGREDTEQDRGFAEEHCVSAEYARDEAEQFRRLADEAREVRDDHREVETVRTGARAATGNRGVGARRQRRVRRSPFLAEGSL
jgi:hypothetical protein